MALHVEELYFFRYSQSAHFWLLAMTDIMLIPELDARIECILCSRKYSFYHIFAIELTEY